MSLLITVEKNILCNVEFIDAICDVNISNVTCIMCQKYCHYKYSDFKNVIISKVILRMSL